MPLGLDRGPAWATLLAVYLRAADRSSTSLPVFPLIHGGELKSQAQRLAASSESVSTGRKTVAVVVPLSFHTGLTADEQTSLNHLHRYLGDYDKFVVIPKTRSAGLPGFGVKRFSDRYFGTVERHNRLMLSRRFYRTFQDYEYILIYHLDALVLSDQLLEWCSRDLDYIGPPWVGKDAVRWKLQPSVGNGGFSLRRIDAFLAVLDSKVRTIDPEHYWSRLAETKSRWARWAHLPRKWAKGLRVFNGVGYDIQRRLRRSPGEMIEDLFWSFEAEHYSPAFRKASVEDGLRFAFELSPRECFEMTSFQLPFGCHAWPRHDRAFWEPYLLADTPNLTTGS